VADGFEHRASFGELSFEFGFADASEPEAITEEVLGLILGGDYDLEAVAFHLVAGVGYGRTMTPGLIPVNIIFHYFAFIFTGPKTPEKAVDSNRHERRSPG
jgi:hypothetical protein